MKYGNNVLACFLALTAAALSTGSVTATAADSAVAAQYSNTDTKGSKASDSNSSSNDLIEIMPEDFKPAFTRDTVTRLNAIVHRSYAIIGQFDEFRKSLNNSPIEVRTQENPSKMLSDNQHALINSLDVRSKMALADMNKAVEELKGSGEHYNTAVLAGMVIFVRNVEQEVDHFYQGSLKRSS